MHRPAGDDLAPKSDILSFLGPFRLVRLLFSLVQIRRLLLLLHIGALHLFLSLALLVDPLLLLLLLLPRLLRATLAKEKEAEDILYQSHTKVLIH